MKLWQRIIFALLLILCIAVSLPAPVRAVELPPALNTTNNPHTSIQNTDELLLYANAQNLVDHWNNLVIRAKTGDEQLQMMRESGVFADDVKLTFDLGDKKYKLNGLSDPQAIQFYNSLVNNLKKYRYNVASNVEAVEFGKDSLLFNFKHLIYFNDRLGVFSDNQVHMTTDKGRSFIDSAYLRLIRFDTTGAY
ncbi:MAG: hypothetical protein ACRC11_10420 [Xenococcaceae cyanobacterium]